MKANTKRRRTRTGDDIKWKKSGNNNRRKTVHGGADVLGHENEDEELNQMEQDNEWEMDMLESSPSPVDETELDTEICLSKKQTHILATLVPDEIIKIDKLNVKQNKCFVCVLLFADVSGFTALCERYNNTGKGGTYRLTVTLNAYIGSMIELIYRHGGDVMKFAGDTFLSLWRAHKNEYISHTIHDVIACALDIQQTLGLYETDVGVFLKVKLAISAGNVRLCPIGDTNDKNFLVAGRPIYEVKDAERLCNFGDIMLAPNAWGHCYSRNYQYEHRDSNHIKIVAILYNPRTDKVQQYNISSGYTVLRQSRKKLHGIEDLPTSAWRSSTNVNPPEVQLITETIQVRTTILEASRKNIGPDLRSFMIKPVLKQIDAHQPLEYLTEMRQVTVMCLTLKPKQIKDDLQLVRTVDQAYQITSRLAYKSMGCVNKITLFDKDVMILVIFGLRGFKHEAESQVGLKCAYRVRKSLSYLDGVASVSIGVTTGQVYCGVVGHPLRREYTVIGATVNKAARIMCAYRNKVTCDHTTYVNSKLSPLNFITQEYVKLKGIDELETVFEYTEERRARNTIETILPLLGRTDEMEFFENLLDKKYISYRDYSGLLILGDTRIGKSRMLDHFTRYARNLNYKVAHVSLSAIHSATPYITINQIINQLLGTSDDNVNFVKEQLIVKTIGSYSDELCYLNNALHVKFPFNSKILKENKQERAVKLRKVFEKLVKSIADNGLISLDDVQNLDTESYTLLDALLNLNSLLLVMTIYRNRFTTKDSTFDLYTHYKVRKLRLCGLEDEFIPALSCQILNLDAIPKILNDAILKKCKNNPGFIESYLVHLFSNGALTLSVVDIDDLSDEINLDDYIFPDVSQLKPVAFLKLEQTALDLQEEEKEEYNICKVITIESLDYNFDSQTLEAVIMKQIDSLTPYQQLLVKTASVIGDYFTRSLLTKIMYENNDLQTAKAISRLFSMRLLQCANSPSHEAPTQNFSSQRTTASNLSTLETRSPLPGSSNAASTSIVDCHCPVQYDPANPDKLPKHAFCLFMKFRSKLTRKTCYELLPGNQKKEFHAKVVEFLENGTHQCSSCGGDIYIVQSFKQINQTPSYLMYRNMITEGGSNRSSLTAFVGNLAQYNVRRKTENFSRPPAIGMQKLSKNEEEDELITVNIEDSKLKSDKNEESTSSSLSPVLLLPEDNRRKSILKPLVRKSILKHLRDMKTSSFSEHAAKLESLRLSAFNEMLYGLDTVKLTEIEMERKLVSNQLKRLSGQQIKSSSSRIAEMKTISSMSSHSVHQSKAKITEDIPDSKDRKRNLKTKQQIKSKSYENIQWDERNDSRRVKRASCEEHRVIEQKDVDYEDVLTDKVVRLKDVTGNTVIPQQNDTQYSRTNSSINLRNNKSVKQLKLKVVATVRENRDNTTSRHSQDREELHRKKERDIKKLQEGAARKHRAVSLQKPRKSLESKRKSSAYFAVKSSEKSSSDDDHNVKNTGTSEERGVQKYLRYSDNMEYIDVTTHSDSIIEDNNSTHRKKMSTSNRRKMKKRTSNEQLSASSDSSLGTPTQNASSFGFLKRFGRERDRNVAVDTTSALFSSQKTLKKGAKTSESLWSNGGSEPKFSFIKAIITSGTTLRTKMSRHISKTLSKERKERRKQLEKEAKKLSDRPSTVDFESKRKSKLLNSINLSDGAHNDPKVSIKLQTCMALVMNNMISKNTEMDDTFSYSRMTNKLRDMFENINMNTTDNLDKLDGSKHSLDNDSLQLEFVNGAPAKKVDKLQKVYKNHTGGQKWPKKGKKGKVKESISVEVKEEPIDEKVARKAKRLAKRLKKEKEAKALAEGRPLEGSIQELVKEEPKNAVEELPKPLVKEKRNSFVVNIKKGVSNVNFKKCSCMELTLYIYEQLIFHAYYAELFEKEVNFLITYANLCILGCDLERALQSLNSALEKCKGHKKAEDDGGTDEHFFLTPYKKKMYVGQILGLRGRAHLENGNVEQAKEDLLISCKLLGFTFRTNHFFVQFGLTKQLTVKWFYQNAPRMFLSVRKRKRHLIEQVIYNLNVLTTLYLTVGNLNIAQLSGQQAINLINTLNHTNVMDICDTYTNMLYIFLEAGDLDRMIALENEVVRKLGSADIIMESHELWMFGKLLSAIFTCRLAKGNIRQASKSGFRALAVGRSICATELITETIPVLAQLMMSQSRIPECIDLLSELLFTAESRNDLLCECWYYAICLDMILDCGVQLESFDAISEFAENVLLVQGTDSYVPVDSPARRRLINSIYLYWSRIAVENEVNQWEKRAMVYSDPPTNNNATHSNIINTLRLIEAMIVSLAFKAENIKSFGDVLRLKGLVEKKLNSLEPIVRNFRSGMPRFYHMKCYASMVKRHDARYIAETRLWCKKCGNLLELQWLNVNVAAWERRKTANTFSCDWIANAKRGRFPMWRFNLRDTQNYLYLLPIPNITL